jgi:hypothetical protein
MAFIPRRCAPFLDHGFCIAGYGVFGSWGVALVHPLFGFGLSIGYRELSWECVCGGIYTPVVACMDGRSIVGWVVGYIALCWGNMRDMLSVTLCSICGKFPFDEWL